MLGKSNLKLRSSCLVVLQYGVFRSAIAFIVATVLSILCVFRYRDRFWRESVFRGVECVRGALDECYGVGVVSLVRAAFRWLNHHSKLNPEHGGEAVTV